MPGLAGLYCNAYKLIRINVCIRIRHKLWMTVQCSFSKTNAWKILPILLYSSAKYQNKSDKFTHKYCKLLITSPSGYKCMFMVIWTKKYFISTYKHALIETDYGELTESISIIQIIVSWRNSLCVYTKICWNDCWLRIYIMDFWGN